MDKIIHFVGFGGAGTNAVLQFASKNLKARYTYITDRKRETSRKIKFIPFKPPKKKLARRIYVSDMRGELQISEEVMKVFNDKDCVYILISGLGGFTGTYMMRDISLMLHNENQKFYSVCFSPLGFETRETKIINKTIKELKLINNLKIWDVEKFAERFDFIAVDNIYKKIQKKAYKDIIEFLSNNNIISTTPQRSEDSNKPESV